MCAVSLTLCACGHHVMRVAATEPTTPIDASAGSRLFTLQCAACHGSGSVAGPVGPPLRGESTRKSRTAIVDAIEQPQPPMPKLFPGDLSPQDVADLTAYVESL